MTAMPFRIMTPIQAAHFRDQTATSQHRLDPIRIVSGPYANRFVVPARVIADPNHADKRAALLMLAEEALDPVVLQVPE